MPAQRAGARAPPTRTRTSHAKDGRSRRGPQSGQHELEAVRASHHRHAGGRNRRRAVHLGAAQDLHQPGHRRAWRGARRRQRHLCADAEEPAARREPLRHRPAVPPHQAVRRPRPAGRRRLGGRDRALGSRRQGLWRADLPDARRQVPRQGAHLLRHRRREAERHRDRQAPQGAHGPRLHLPQDGPRA